MNPIVAVDVTRFVLDLYRNLESLFACAYTFRAAAASR
jgi:hypothetical protein